MPKTKASLTKQSTPAKNTSADAVLDSRIQTAIQQIPQSNDYLIGFSGGLDSLALIHFCAPYLRQFTNSIKAIHVHHGLSERADEWVQFCKKVCQSSDIELIVEQVQVLVEGEGLEAAARQARYQVFSKYMQKGSVLLLGHHLNDQAETLLMRFLKGLGPSALRGISRSRDFAGGIIFRPWLRVPRALLKKNLLSICTDWVEDESNLDRRFERNFLRHEILPLLEARRPSVLEDLQHAAARSSDYVDFVEQWCRQQESQFLSQAYSMERAIDLVQLRQFSVLQQKFILRYWFDFLGVHQPGDSNFNRIINDLVAPDATSKAEVVWRDYCVRVFDGALFCFKSVELQSQAYACSVSLANLLKQGELPFKLELPGGMLCIELVTDEEEFVQKRSVPEYLYQVVCFIPADIRDLVIRSKRPGDAINLQSDFSHALKKLYQAHRVLPWHRECIPVFQASPVRPTDPSLAPESSKLAASLAGFVAQPFKAQHSPSAVKLRFSYLTKRGLLDIK